MKLCLAAMNSKQYVKGLEQCKYSLESFYYIEPWQLDIIKQHKLFLLDSGAFTFMNNCKVAVNWLNYIEQYVAFINKNDVKFFFELDIDCIVGLDQVESFRDFIEKETGKKSIPVWHKSRGLQYWIDLCQTYDYVAIGGIVTKEIKPNQYKFFAELIRIAKKHNTKVHGLGYTGKDADKYGFYSIDSTSWGSGSRFGQLYIFNKRYMQGTRLPGKRIRDYKIIDQHNYQEWLKYQAYLDNV